MTARKIGGTRGSWEETDTLQRVMVSRFGRLAGEGGLG